MVSRNLLEASFLQPHLQADPILPDFASPELTLGDEKLELSRRVGAAPEHRPQDELCHEGVHQADLHPSHLPVDFSIRRLPAQVLDHRSPTGAQDAVHLFQGDQRLREVLERGLADNQVKGACLPRHLARVAVPEFDVHGPERDAVLSGPMYQTPVKSPSNGRLDFVQTPSASANVGMKSAPANQPRRPE